MLAHPYVVDVDSTVKPIYGHQEGAELGYNPAKPGRPSHNYQSFFIGRARVTLGVDVRRGSEHSGRHGMPGLLSFLDSLPPKRRQALVRGGVGYGTDEIMVGVERRVVLVRRPAEKEDPSAHREAVTSRPTYKGIVGRIVESGRRRTIRLRIPRNPAPGPDSEDRQVAPVARPGRNPRLRADFVREAGRDAFASRPPRLRDSSFSAFRRRPIHTRVYVELPIL